MKITVSPDGTLELEVTDGDSQAALEIIRSLQAPQGVAPESEGEPSPEPVEPRDPAALSRPQRETYEVIASHPQGCHYTKVAEILGLEPTVINSRLGGLRKLGYVEWIRAGVYRAF